MERKKSTVSPENYTRAILSLSRRYSSTSVFPGNNYIAIGEWMLQDRSLLSATKTDETLLFASPDARSHDLVVVYNSNDGKWDVQSYTQEQHEDFSAATSSSDVGFGQMIFIRGFTSPLWVAAIGSKYSIDPEFFRRHMDFLSPSINRHAYGFPSLTTTSNDIFRLCVSTILHRDDFSGEDLQRQRSDQSAELGAYRIQQLGSSKVCCGDSLVREYSTICSSFSVVEQWISLYLARTESGWSVVAWLDHGRPLETSPPGPWTSHIESKATPIPVLQHHRKMAFRTTTNRLDPEVNASAEVQQSTSVLPLQYDSLVAMVDLARRAPQDPLSMCIPLFAHAAFSEVQFLNLMECKIQAQINDIAEGVSPEAYGTFQYFSGILNRHALQLKDSTRALGKLSERSVQVCGRSQSPASPGLGILGVRRNPSDTDTIRSVGGGRSTSDGTFTSKGLFEDYEQLHLRCVDLSKMCSEGITLAMNKATIEESSKAIEKSDTLKKLTLLATFFIPLSFSSSLFGMNIDVLGQSTVKFWWFFVICIPIVLSAYAIYSWDSVALKRHWRLFWKGCSNFTRDAKGGKSATSESTKDPSHVV